MSCTITTTQEQIIHEIIDQSFAEPSKIESIASQCGYILNGSFLPEEFERLYSEVSKIMLKTIKENLAHKQAYSSDIESNIHKLTEQLIHEKLEKICRITPQSQIRTPYPFFWNWISSIWSSNTSPLNK